MALWISYIFLSLYITTGNVLVMITISFTKSLHSKSNLLVLSLSIADLCVGLILLPMRISEALNAPWTTTIEYCRIAHGLVLLNLSASMFHIVIIAIDRYIASFHPFTYESITLNKCQVWLEIILTWLISLTVAFLPSMGIGASSQSGTRKLTGVCLFAETLHPQYALFYASCIFCSSFVIVTVLYTRLYLLARNHIKRIAALDVISWEASNSSNIESISEDSKVTNVESVSTQSVDNAVQNNYNRSNARQRRTAMELKAAKVMGIVVGVLYVCWLPNVILMVITAVCRKCSNQFSVTVIIFIVYMNSGLNPIIYYSRLKTYRQATKRMLRKICRR